MASTQRGAVTLFGALALLLLAAVVGALALGLATGVLLLAGHTPAEAAVAVGRDPLLLGLCQLAGLVTATGVGVLATQGADVSYRDALALRAVPAVLVLLALAAGAALQFPLHEIANLLAHLEPSLGLDPEAQARLAESLRIEGLLDALRIPLAVVAIPALSEELLFRGLLLPGLERRHGPRAALYASSLLFGAIHVMPVAIVYASLAGLALGWVRQRTGSVLPCIAMHGAFNAVPVLLPAQLVRIQGFNTVEDGVYHLPLALVLGSAAVVGFSLLVMSRLTDARE